MGNLRWILQIYLFWLIGVGQGKRGFYFWQKPNEAKAFFRFCGLVESRADSVFLRVRFCVESGGIVEFIGWILRNYGIAGGFKSLKRGRILLLAKAKSSKNF